LKLNAWLAIILIPLQIFIFKNWEKICSLDCDWNVKLSVIFDESPLTYRSIVLLDGKRSLKLERESHKREKMQRYWIRLSCSHWQILCDIRLNYLSIGSKIKNVKRFTNAYPLKKRKTQFLCMYVCFLYC
jgi:hypothetical protein